MLPKSDTYNRLIHLDNHWFITRLVVKTRSGADVGIITERSLISVNTQSNLFSESTPVVGSCVASEIDVKCYAPDFNIPKMARLEPQIQIHALENGVETADTAWMPQGVFYIDTRSKDVDTDVLTMHGYDAMMLMEQPMHEALSWTSARVDRSAVQAVAQAIGITVETTTLNYLNKGYKPKDWGTADGALTMREVMGYIAASYCGNWHITMEGNLRLIVLGVGPLGLPEETFFLVDHENNNIVFGEDRILLR